MSDPIELEENFVLTVSDQGYADPLAHAVSHQDGGADELLLAMSQVSGLGTMASQNKGTVDIEGGTIDATPIGGTTKAAGGFTTGAFTGNVAIAGTLSVTGAVTLTVPLAVNQGGTGAITDAGARTNLGIGTLATQNKTLVDIEGGTIDATPIGGTTKAAGGFTTGTFTGNVTVAGTLTVTGALTLTIPLAVAQGGTGAATNTDARTNLGLVIGTHVQAYDADLSAIAGLTSAADKVPYFTGSGTAGVADFTTTGRTIVAAASATAARTALEIRVGSGTLVLGTKAIPVIGVTAASKVFAGYTGAVGSTFGSLRAVATTDTVTVTSYDAAGTAPATDTNDVFVLAIG